MFPITPPVLNRRLLGNHSFSPQATHYLHPIFCWTECPGVDLHWPLGDTFRTYPFHRHAPDADSPLKWTLCGFNEGNQTFRIRSLECTRQVITPVTICSSCASLQPLVEAAATKTGDPSAGTNDVYRSYKGMLDVASRLRSTSEAARLKLKDLYKAMERLTAKINIHNQLLVLLSTHHLPRLHSIIATALRQNLGIQALSDRCINVIGGAYRSTRRFLPWEYDLGLLALRLSGSTFVYALNHCIGLPSVRTIKKSCAPTKVLTCLSLPDAPTIIKNIQNVVLVPFQAMPSSRPRTGIAIMQDEVAIEPQPCYLRGHNAVGGLCSHSTKDMDLHINSWESLNAVAEHFYPSNPAVEPSGHVATQGSVTTVAFNGQEDYGAKPVVAYPTCGKKDAAEAADFIDIFILCWLESGAVENVGWFWFFATDGDSARRKGWSSKLLAFPLDTSASFYPYLAGLQGLNLQVGPHNITLDFDFKHIIKRKYTSFLYLFQHVTQSVGISTSLRSKNGILINQVAINPGILAKHLALSGLCRRDILFLLEPSDSQDVPRAVELIKSLGNIASKELKQPNPSTVEEHAAILVLSELYLAFLHPFLDPSISLSRQMELLSKYAHMAAYLYCQHKTRFMPSVLYYDSQTCIKNAFFTVARQQALDATQPVFLFQNGDDREESLFGKARMDGGHHSSMNMAELGDRLGHAIDIDNVLSRHPDWYSGHRRLKMTRGEHVDHLNPASCTNTQILLASSVNLKNSWDIGALEALNSLHSINLGPLSTKDFFPPNADLLRPNGDGYVSLGNNFESISEPPVTAVVFESDNQPTDLLPVNQEDQDWIDDIAQNTLQMMPLASIGVATTTTAEAPLIPDSSCMDELEPNLDEDSTEDDYIVIQGRKTHKASAVRLRFMTDYFRQGTTRLLRVCGHTLHYKADDFKSNDAQPSSDCFYIGECVATLILCAGTASLALIKTTQLLLHGAKVTEVRRSEIGKKGAGISLSGQVLELSPPSPLDDSSTAAFWRWNGAICAFKTSQSSTVDTVELACPGYLTVPFPGDMPIRAIDEHWAAKNWHGMSQCPITTWSLTNQELDTLLNSAVQQWELHQNELVGQFFAATSKSGFPYCDHEGMLAQH
jgi:hypothetical protein